MSALKRLQPSGRPTAQECRAIIEALAQLHGRPNRLQHSAGLQPGCELKEPHTVLDSLVRTILSQNTTDITSHRAFTTLKQTFPAWEMVRTAPPGAVEEAIRVGGLAAIKTERIKAILNSLLSERGELSLEHLRDLPGDDIKQQLGKYKGVGPKSIACVMLFCLGRAECPVDTHVWEISKQLGWVPQGATREATYEYLNAVVPDDHKYEMHVLLVEHGKVCPRCFKRGSAGVKRKGKGAAAAATTCPLEPFKRGNVAATSSDAAAAASGKSSSETHPAPASAEVKVKVEVAAAEDAAAAGMSEELQPFVYSAAAAVVKTEPAVVVKTEPTVTDSNPPDGQQQQQQQTSQGSASRSRGGADPSSQVHPTPAGRKRRKQQG